MYTAYLSLHFSRLTLSSFVWSKGNSSLSPFSLSFLSRDRDLFDRSLPEREDFEPVRRFSLLSPLVYREQSMSTNYFIVTIFTKRILDKFVTKEKNECYGQSFLFFFSS